jgi:hypothetical protein
MSSAYLYAAAGGIANLTYQFDSAGGTPSMALKSGANVAARRQCSIHAKEHLILNRYIYYGTEHAENAMSQG